MYYIHFLEEKNVLLSQFRKQIPVVDEELKIKGRKAKVLNVVNLNETHINVYVSLEKVVKKQLIDLSKKKKK
ncbi:hypothetical protein [Sutcliffiella rhizosphaerae]|uniref:Preprotein translocase subunit SecA n=1 Tax=Sutcliffiella rhizosphaerae TaxID=2880967 RepID=A0ABM8YNY3_9BACI|nr:hypothetical protein [Sutcliffiella rhizosphaerae]CAG9621607.1 hypothetical protein BACCIP111883_02380 [Sutcliffiella rhizosphaerae]